MTTPVHNEKRRASRRRRAWAARAGGVGQRSVSDGLCALLMAAALCWWATSVSLADAPSSHTVQLDCQEQAFSFFNMHLVFVPQDERFVREPEAGPQAVRGKLMLGGAERNALAVLWDREAGRLHLDFNRNLDLTDDADGVVQVQKRYGDHYQSFSQVPLPLLDPAGLRLAGDLTLWDYGRQPGASFALRSMWQGRALLHGEEWQIGLIWRDLNRPLAMGNGFLLLRPWSSRVEPFNVTDGSLRAVGLAPSLFLNGHAYEISLSDLEAGNVSLSLGEAKAVLGEANIGGDHIQRLVLESGGQVVVLDQPAGAVRLPVGSYGSPQAWLQHGKAGARTAPARSASGSRVTVSEFVPAVIEVGGPLTNSVTVSRRGSRLHMSYQLLGRGGQAYRLDTEDHSNPPRFAVFREGRQVGAGQFEYG